MQQSAYLPTYLYYIVMLDITASIKPSQAPPPLGYCCALYNFSANEPNQLSFMANDRITIVNKNSGNQFWWRGRLNGRVLINIFNFIHLAKHISVKPLAWWCKTKLTGFYRLHFDAIDPHDLYETFELGVSIICHNLAMFDNTTTPYSTTNNDDATVLFIQIFSTKSKEVLVTAF